MRPQVLYRVAPGFLLQFGVAADPAVQVKWDNRLAAVVGAPAGCAPPLPDEAGWNR